MVVYLLSCGCESSMALLHGAVDWSWYLLIIVTYLLATDSVKAVVVLLLIHCLMFLPLFVLCGSSSLCRGLICSM